MLNEMRDFNEFVLFFVFCSIILLVYGTVWTALYLISYFGFHLLALWLALLFSAIITSVATARALCQQQDG